MTHLPRSASQSRPVLLAAVSVITFLAPAAFVHATTYSGPITITAGGVYSGNWQSLDPNTPAVSIRTTAPVTITNSNIQSESTLIDINQSGANVTITNTNGYALNPGVVGDYPGRFIDAEGISSLTVEHNYFELTRGIYVLQPTSGATIRVRYNSVKNLSARQSTGSGWTTTDVNPDVAQLTQFDKVNGATAEIAWNQVINDPYVSRPEDVVNMYASNGTSANPISIHDNYIRGSYPGYPDTDSFSGGGIIADGSNTSYLKVYNNQVIETVNYGIAIAGGSNNEFYGNTVMGTGLLPDGNRAAAQNVGMYVNGSGTGNSMHDNTVGWYDASGSRNDWWFPNCPSGSCNYNNTQLPDPITLSQEDAQFTTWQNKLSANGITAGPTGGTTDTTAPSVPTGLAGTAVSSSQVNLTWNASTDNVGVAGYKVLRGGVQIGTTANTSFSDTGLSAGTTATYTVAAYDAAGNTSAQSSSVSVSTPATLPTAFITASPTSITAGQSSTLTWSSSNATSCTGTNFSTGNAVSGSVSVTPSVTTTYSVTCTGAGGTSAPASVSVSVTSADTTVPTTSISSPANGAVVTGTTTVSIAASDNVGVTKVELYKDSALFGTDTSSPYAFTWVTTEDTNASHTLQSKAYDASGNIGSSATVMVTVSNSSTPAPAASLTANPASILSGQSSTLTWSSTNATGCSGTGFNANNAVSGSVSVTPSVTTTYSVTCTGAGGSATASATVTVSTVSPAFGIGARVKTTDYLNVRTKPNLKSGKALCTQPPGALGTIIDGPKSGNGYTWWNVNYDSGCDGWSAQSYLTTNLAIVPITDTLAKGASGAQVMALQNVLARRGFFTDGITGYFGILTEAAVKAFQTANNLAAVGLVGPQTRDLLNQLGF